MRAAAKYEKAVRRIHHQAAVIKATGGIRRGEESPFVVGFVPTIPFI